MTNQTHQKPDAITAIAEAGIRKDLRRKRREIVAVFMVAVLADCFFGNIASLISISFSSMLCVSAFISSLPNDGSQTAVNPPSKT